MQVFILFTKPLGTLVKGSYGYSWVTHNYSRVIHNYHNYLSCLPTANSAGDR